MTYEIKPTCPKCGNVLTVRLNIVDKLRAEIADLKKQLKDAQGLESLKSIFGGFK